MSFPISPLPSSIRHPHDGSMPGNIPPGNMAGMGAGPAPGPNMIPVANQNAQMAGQIHQSGSGSHPNPNPNSSANQPQHQDSIARLKTLVPQLRKSLGDLMEIAASHIINNSNMDNGIPKANDDPVPRFDKTLEDFYSLCNQIEYCLRTILECAIQTRDSNTYIPFQISKDYQTEMTPGNMMQDNSISYTQYLNIVKKQVNYAKSVYDILSETVKQIRHSDIPNILPPQQQQQPPSMNPVNPMIQQQQQQQQANMS